MVWQTAESSLNKQLVNHTATTGCVAGGGNGVSQLHRPKKYFSAIQRDCFEEPILLQLFVEPVQSSMVYQLLFMVNQTFCIVCKGIHISWLTFTQGCSQVGTCSHTFLQ